MTRRAPCYRCKRLTHRDELSLRRLEPCGRCWVCLYCVTEEFEAANRAAAMVDGLALEAS
jgi:hypothetical protein